MRNKSKLQRAAMAALVAAALVASVSGAGAATRKVAAAGASRPGIYNPVRLPDDWDGVSRLFLQLKLILGIAKLPGDDPVGSGGSGGFQAPAQRMPVQLAPSDN